MWGRLEHEIRLLPQVLACSFTRAGDVVVLVEPSADTWSTERAVRAILARGGNAGGVRIAGGAGFAPVSIPSPPSGRPLLVGALGATAMLAASSLIGGLVFVSKPGENTARRGDSVLASAPETFDTGLRAIRALLHPSQPEEHVAPGGTIPRSEEALPQALGVSGDVAFARALALGSAAKPSAEAGRPQTSGAPRRKSGIASLGGVENQDAECHDPPERGAPRARRGRHQGKGPRGWSRSILVEPQTCGD